MLWKFHLKVGDIILARRYHNEEEKNKLGKNHQVSPFVIIKKSFFKVYALQCTTNGHQNLSNSHLYFFLGKLKYQLDKNCYVNNYESYVINKEQFIKKLSHLTKDDLNKLMKNNYLVSKYKNTKIAKNIKHHFTYDIGDVISYQNNKYYVYDTDKQYLSLIKLSLKPKARNKITINNTDYGFNFALRNKISKKHHFKLIDTFDNGQIMLVKKYESIYNERLLARKSAPTIGCLVKYKDKLYYIYGDEGNCYQAIILYDTSLKKQMKKITIENGTYYTFLEKQLLKRNKEFIVKRKASEEEISANILLINTKRYHKKDLLFYEPMMIVTNTLNKENYLILSRKDNIVDLVNINNLSDNYEFLIEDNCPLRYFKSLDEEEFNKYQIKINELKQLAKDIC